MNLPSPKRDLSVKNILKLSFPTVASQITLIVYGVLDSFFMGQLGTTAIAVSYIASNIWLPISEVLDGLRTGTTVFTTRFAGNNQKDNVSKTLNIGLFSAIIIGGLVCLSAGYFSKIYFSLMSSGSVQDLGAQFLHIYLLSAPFAIIQFVITGFFAGLKDTLTPFIVTGATSFFSIFLEYIFLYGKFGFPKLGLQGVVISTLIAYVIGAVLSIIFLIKKKAAKQYFNLRIPFKSLQKDYTKISFSMGLYVGLLDFTFIIFAYMFSSLGQANLAVQQVTFQVYSFSYYPMVGFLSAASIIIGNLVGSRKDIFIRYAILKLATISFVIFSFLSLFIFIFSPFISSVFSPHDPVVASILVKTIKIIAINNMICSVYVVFRGALIGLKDSKILLISAIINGYLVFLPLSYILGIKLGMGAIGGFIAFLCWTISDTLFFAWRLFINKGWKVYVEGTQE